MSIKKINLIFICFILIFSFFVTPFLFADEKNEDLYLKNNIHYEEKSNFKGNITFKASYANYVDSGEFHSFVPVNTAVKIEPWQRRYKSYGLIITILENSRKIYFEINPKNVKFSTESYARVING